MGRVGHGGESEELLGQWMRARGNRDDLVIATKCARPERPFSAKRGYAHPTAYVRFETIRGVAGDLGATVNQVVLAWLLHHGAVPLVGVSSIAQLEEALAAVELKVELKLDAELVAQLDKA